MKHHILGRSLAVAAFALTLQSAQATVTATFESVPLDGFGLWKGTDGSGGFSDGAHFNNLYDAGFDSWSGFAVSNHTDTTTAGWFNQYSAYTGGGAGGSAQYAIGYDGGAFGVAPIIDFGSVIDLTGLGAMITNTTYSALSMRDGDMFAKKFGGATGNDEDWFLLTMTAYAGGSATGSSLDFYLADFRFSDNAEDYIIDQWTPVDFTPLGGADELRFSFSSSDNGASGMNTPGYFAMDNVVVPEPSALLCSFIGFGLLARRRR